MKTVLFADLKIGDFVVYGQATYQVVGILKDLENFSCRPDLPKDTYIIQLDRVYANGQNWISGTRHSAIHVLDNAIASAARCLTS